MKPPGEGAQHKQEGGVRSDGEDDSPEQQAEIDSIDLVLIHCQILRGSLL